MVALFSQRLFFMDILETDLEFKRPYQWRESA